MQDWDDFQCDGAHWMFYHGGEIFQLGINCFCRHFFFCVFFFFQNCSCLPFWLLFEERQQRKQGQQRKAGKVSLLQIVKTQCRPKVGQTAAESLAAMHEQSKWRAKRSGFEKSEKTKQTN